MYKKRARFVERIKKKEKISKGRPKINEINKLKIKHKAIKELDYEVNYRTTV